MKNIIIGFALISLLVSCGGATKEADVEVMSVSLNQTKIEMIVGETSQLQATVKPSSATDKTVNWSSSKQSVATVNNSGLVTAVAEGTASITAVAGGKSASCKVTVSKQIVAVTSISLDKTTLSLKKGESEKLEATVKPDDATDKTVAWSSSNKQIASVDQSGNVSALAGGTAVITAKAGEKTATCEVSITVPVESVSLDRTSAEMIVGDELSLTATVNPEDATDKTVSWSTSDASVATVEGGKVTAIKEGEATIMAKAGEKTAECKITVAKKVIAVTSIELDKSSIEFFEGDSEIITATVKPDNATDKTVHWSSSESSVVSVNQDGTVTGISEGEANVIAEAGGKSATCHIIVINKEQAKPIQFADSNLKTELVQHFDFNGDGEISYYEATKVTSIANVLGTNRGFVSFNEFQYFTSITVVPYQGFWYWEQLNSIILPKSVETINDYAFYHCASLTGIELHDGITEIGTSAFQYSGLKSIILPATLQTIKSYAFNSTSIEDIVIPVGVTVLSHSIFGGCRKLKTVSLPANLESIDDYAFHLCPIESVTIPPTVTSIGKESLDATKVIYCEPVQVPRGASEMFSKTAIIYVPAESLEAYKKAEFWSAYAEQIHAIQ